MSISINDYKKPILELTQEDRRFLELINNRITLYGQIPYTIPEKLIIDLIKESALYFFRLGYWRSQQTVFYRLPKEEIIDFTSKIVNKEYSNFKGYAVKLPPFVNDIRDIWECNKHYLSTQEIFDTTNIMTNGQQASPYGYSMTGINTNLYIYEVAVKMVEQSAWQSTMGTSVPFRYNNANKTLIINKEMKSETVSYMLQCDCNVDIQLLYIDDLFIKYVLGRCKQELKRLLGGHTFTLPGEVTMNADEICYGADTDVEQVNEVLKGATGIGDLILQR